MKGTLKNLVLGAILAEALAIFGCSDKFRSSNYIHSGVFDGLPVEIGVKEDQRYIRIAEDWGNRGYKPANLKAIDINPDRFGFEYSGIQFTPAYDLITGEDSSKVSALKKFRDPIELERIFAYIGIDRGRFLNE